MYLQAHPKRYDEGREYLQRIKEWVDHGEYPNVTVVDVFKFHPITTLKICKVKTDESFYHTMIDCIEEQDLKHFKPYEHR